MATYIVEAADPYGEALLYVLKSKREAVQTARIEAENYRSSGGNGPDYIVVSKWDYESQGRDIIERVRV